MALTATGAAAAPRARVVATPRASGEERYATSSWLNWSGYVKTGSGISGATGTFTVPRLLTTYNGYSSMWVGVDGASSSDRYLIQTGIEADVVNHKAGYNAWWELITPS
ncbi:G1 family glutamic endopeptidase, partial [Jatrophihabitans sp.]|uniref:G1 family glutamic endopeptidase n=1 Tax=Jatrophihabitans sp. TaxID=1932789 RepID=UPI0030C771A7